MGIKSYNSIRANLFEIIAGHTNKCNTICITTAYLSIKELAILAQNFRADAEVYVVCTMDITDKNRIQDIMKKEVVGILQADESSLVDNGIIRLKDMIKSNKLKIKYINGTGHSKIYCGYYKKLDCHGDFDSVSITEPGFSAMGSANLTPSGLLYNGECITVNDEVPDETWVEVFNDSWKKAYDLTPEIFTGLEKLTISIKSFSDVWKLYIKALYECFDAMKIESNETYNIMELEYQQIAVNELLKILSYSDGAFLSDVVGLGKTYIALRLAARLPGKTLVIVPTRLVDQWNESRQHFNSLRNNSKLIIVAMQELNNFIKTADIESIDNIFIDEAHNFRNSSSQRYTKLVELTYGKKVLLVTATPQNNSITDIKNEISLYQNMSTVTDIENGKQATLESFLDKLIWQSDVAKKEAKDGTITHTQMQHTLAGCSNELRKYVLTNVMVRRTRGDIKKYFEDDLNKQGVNFPEVTVHEPVPYSFRENIDQAYTITLLAFSEYSINGIGSLKLIHYSLADYADNAVEGKGMRLTGLARTIFVKRLESSYSAFKQSIDRLLNRMVSLDNLLDKHQSKTEVEMEEDESDLEDSIDSSEGFYKLKKVTVNLKKVPNDFRQLLKEDIAVVKYLIQVWDKFDMLGKDDSKFYEFNRLMQSLLKEDPKRKIVVFSEAIATVEYLSDRLPKENGLAQVLKLHGSNRSALFDQELVSNFSTQNDKSTWSNKYNIVICTDILSEGKNLQRADVVINYDIPWNPVKVMQRIGRINRIDTTYNSLHVYNFMPSDSSESAINTKANIVSKVTLFLKAFGDDIDCLGALKGNEDAIAESLYDELKKKIDDIEDSLGTVRSLEYAKKAADLFKDSETVKKVRKVKDLKLKASVHGKLMVEDGFESEDKVAIVLLRLGNETYFMQNVNGVIAKMDVDLALKLFEKYKDSEGHEVSPEYNSYINSCRSALRESIQKKKDLQKRTLELDSNLESLKRAMETVRRECKELMNIRNKHRLDNFIARLNKGQISSIVCKTYIKEIKKYATSEVAKLYNDILIERKFISDYYLSSLGETEENTLELRIALCITY